MRRYAGLLATIAIVSLLGCAKDREADVLEIEAVPATPEMGTLTVFTVNYPLRYFVERIGGERVEVRFPAPADVDPAYWSPDAETIAAYQQADLILLNGAGYAKWMEKATLPTSKLVDTLADYQDRLLLLEEGTVHAHGLEGEHSHKGYAFTTWLDPTLAIEQARASARALAEIRPNDEPVFQSGLESLVADLEALDERQARLMEGIQDLPLLFSHPVYQYLIERYQLNGRSLHWEPEEPPSPEQWEELGKLLEGHPAGWMIWEAEPAPETEQKLRGIGVRSVVYEPGGNTPSSGDLLELMQRNADALSEIGE